MIHCRRQGDAHTMQTFLRMDCILLLLSFSQHKFRDFIFSNLQSTRAAELNKHSHHIHSFIESEKSHQIRNELMILVCFGHCWSMNTEWYSIQCYLQHISAVTMPSSWSDIGFFVDTLILIIYYYMYIIPLCIMAMNTKSTTADDFFLQ